MKKLPTVVGCRPNWRAMETCISFEGRLVSCKMCVILSFFSSDFGLWCSFTWNSEDVPLDFFWSWVPHWTHIECSKKWSRFWFWDSGDLQHNTEKFLNIINMMGRNLESHSKTLNVCLLCSKSVWRSTRIWNLSKNVDMCRWIWCEIWKMMGRVKRTLKIAWSVRRWRSVKTKRGFLGCGGWSGESSFLLQAEKYREKACFFPSWTRFMERRLLFSKAPLPCPFELEKWL